MFFKIPPEHYRVGENKQKQSWIKFDPTLDQVLTQKNKSWTKFDSTAYMFVYMPLDRSGAYIFWVFVIVHRSSGRSTGADFLVDVVLATCSLVLSPLKVVYFYLYAGFLFFLGLVFFCVPCSPPFLCCCSLLFVSFPFCFALRAASRYQRRGQTL